MLNFYLIYILYRDNDKWGWFIWRIRYQLIALVANPQKPTSSSSPWTRAWDTGVIRHAPLKDLSWTEFQLYFIDYLTRPLGFFFVYVDTDKVVERILVRYHATHDGSWGLIFVKYYGIQRFYRGGRALRIYCRVPLLAAGMVYLFESYDDIIFWPPDGST